MKKLFLFFTLLLLMGFIKLNWQEQKINAFIQLKKQTAYSCSPAFEEVTDSTINGKFITVLPGWGHYGYPVSTKSDSAQFYFNQGLNMYYSYHWMLPARQYLGLFYLKLNKPALAEKVYKEDLIWNPGNGWSNLGLYQSLKKQNKTSVLGKYQKTYLHAFSGAEKLPPASAYIN